MHPIRIDTPGDPRLAEYAAVSDPALARFHGLFVAEGRLVVGRVLADPRYTPRSLLLNDAAFRALEPALRRRACSVPVYLVPTDLFRPASGVNIHRGCLALVERPEPRALDELLPAARTLVVLDEVANPDNVGGVFRNALALGADGILLGPGCADPLYRKTIRTSMGASLAVPFVHLNPWPDGLDVLRTRGFTLAALTARADAPALECVADPPGAREPRPPIALLAGSEGSGLSPAVEARATCHARIPMRPGADSLNVAVAVGIALYRLGER